MDSTALAKFESLYIPEPNSGCWLWLGTLCGGYGNLYIPGQSRWAHRCSYEHFIGPIPRGLVLDHKCRVLCCVNPNHLQIVTSGENVLLGIGLSAQNARKTHCKHGHEFTPENTAFTKKGRYCRACHVRIQRGHRARRRQRKGSTQ